MAFDAEIHTIDPATGFHIHKETGHRIGVDPAPIKRLSDETEYPKWVVPHYGHIKRHEIHGYVTTPEWGEMFQARNGEITVLVHNAEEEERALADPDPPPPPAPVEALEPPSEAA